jgi:hypothetical protein
VSILANVAVGQDGLYTLGIDEVPLWAFPAAWEPVKDGWLEPLTVASDSRFSANAYSSYKKRSGVLSHLANPQ